MVRSSVFTAAIAALVVAVSPATGLAATNIIIDGNPFDWATVPIVYTDAEARNLPVDLYSVRVTQNAAGTSLFFRLDFNRFVTNNATVVTVQLRFPDGTSTSIVIRRSGGNQAATYQGTNLGILMEDAPDLGPGFDFMELALPTSLLPPIWSTTHSFSFGSSVNPVGGGDVYTPSTCGPLNNSLCWMNYDGTTDTTNDAQVISLSAEPRAGGVVVEWETGAEVDCAGFLVFRRTHFGLVPVTLDIVPGAGTAGSGGSYSVFDASGRAGDSYLLQDVDEDGSVTDHPEFTARRGSARRHAASSLRRPEARATPEPRIQAALAGSGLGEAAILGANAPGAFVVDEAELVAAGVDPVVARSRTIRLTRRGAEVRSLPGPQPGSHLFFATRPSNGYDGVDRYRLEAGSNRAASPARPTQEGRGVPLEAFRSTVRSHGEEVYDWYAEGADPYAWRLIRPTARGSVLVSAPAPFAGGAQAFLSVVLSGGRDNLHRYEVRLNGAFVGLAEWSNKSRTEVRFPLAPLSLDPSGRNLLEVVAAPGVAPADYVYLHDVEVDYDRAFVADGDRLDFEAPAGATVRVAGFGSADVILLDVTEAGEPARLAAATLQDAAGFTLAFTPPGDGVRRFHATTAAALRHPFVRAAAARAQEQERGENGERGERGENGERGERGHHGHRHDRAEVPGGADLLVVTTAELRPALEPLLAFRRAEGLEVEVVTVEEAYDRYTHGDAGPAAIRALVDDALATWAPAPRYLLLAGQGSMDPRGTLGFPADREQVPVAFVRPVDFFIRAPSDASYGLDGNTMRLAIGRIPASTPAQLTAVVNKILAQEGSAGTGRVLAIADGWDGGPTTKFEGALSEIVASLPAASVTTLHARTDPRPGATLASTLSSGVGLVAYAGHGWTAGWGWDHPFLESAAAARLQNETRPVVVTSTCWEGNYSDPRSTSVAWALLSNAGGGSIGNFAPTTVLPSRAHEPLARAIVEALGSGTPRLGDAIRAGQQAALDDVTARRDAILTFGLLGDPAARSPAAP